MRLGLPPSPSVDAAKRRVATLVQTLAAHAVAVEPVVADGYAALVELITRGAVDAAWAPPIVCARVEAAGGRPALRAVRRGSTSYRGALVCRAGEPLDLSCAKSMTAAWVDEHSAGGYLLARAWLTERNVDAVRGFRRALFCGSYAAALQAVAEKNADVTSIFVDLDGEHSTLDEVDEKLRARLHIVAQTAETQNDGIVLPPGPSRATSTKLVDALARLSSTDTGRAALKQAFSCDELRASSGATSTALSALAR